MKRLIIISIILVTLILLAVWGDRIAGRALDAELGDLLTEELGLPVQLAPIKAELLRLTASTGKLVMGDPDNPAVLATDVVVRLSMSALLEGEIRLVYASATDLMVRASNWPSSGGPWPEDYLFLEQWLPRGLEVETGRYVTERGNDYPVKNFHWRREADGGASLNWLEDRAGNEVAISTELASLDDLLNLAPITLQLNGGVTGEDDSQIAAQLAMKPQQPSGYTLDANIEAADMQVHVIASNESPWSLPTRSKTHSASLDVGKLRTLLSHYNAENVGTITAETQQAGMLDLPEHAGEVAIDEIRLGDEVGRDTTFNFTTNAQGVQVSKLTSKGPTGILQGQFDIQSSKEGLHLQLLADMTTREADASIAAQFLDANWLWYSGHADLSAQGKSWGSLLSALDGDITLEGFHRGQVKTPLKLSAQLDSRPDEMALDHMLIEIGEGRINGSATLSDDERRKLTLHVTGETLHLDFLFADKDAAPKPGVTIPDYLGAIPGIDVSATLDIRDLQMPGLNLTRADISLERNADGGELRVEAVGATHGTLSLALDAHSKEGQPLDMTLVTNIKQLDIPAVFEQTDILFDSRSTGTVVFEGSGASTEEVFKAMRGRAQLSVDFRTDNNWKRASSDEEKLTFAGSAELIIKGDQILGLELSGLDIDSFKQDLDGTVSIAAERTPWLIADLRSNRLNIDKLLGWIPKSAAQADDQDILTTVRDMGAVEMSLTARSLILRDVSLENMSLEVTSAPNIFTVNKLDFTTADSELKTHGEIRWKGKKAQLEAAASVDQFDLDRFVISDPTTPHVPVTGTVSLDSQGSKFAELLSNLTGHIKLSASHQQANPSPRDRRDFDMKVKQMADGMHADITSLQWGKSELAGSVRYRKTTPPLLEVEVSSGSLSLLRWEDADPASAKKGKQKKDKSGLAKTASSSASLIRKVLLSPSKLFSGTREAAPGDRFFSDQPLPLDALKKNNARFKGRLDSLISSVGTAKDLTFDGNLLNGHLQFKTQAASVNQGSGEIDADFNTKTVPPSARLKVTFENVHGRTDKSTYPRSGFASVTSRGGSEAELAANLNGVAYLELGKGPMDYKRSFLFTGDLATNMFRALIPGIENNEPEIECGVTAALFKDGMVETPYGFVARTHEANLLGTLRADLKKETMQAQFSARSREGVGLSVGSVFSNTVQIRGPLTNPSIVPRTTGILWRGWAAFMTAGLSVVGESVIKRALASENPCKSLKKDLRKGLCTENEDAAASPLVCGG